MRHTSAALLILCGLGLAPATQASVVPPQWLHAQLGQSVQEVQRNAALDYWRLVNTTPYEADLPARAREVISVLHPGPDGDAGPVEAPATLRPGGELEAELAEIADFLDDLQRASRETHCDFQVRYEDGYAALLPHLGQMRQFARLLAADARRLALAGDEEGAAERLATMLRMARHLTGDRILISSLVSAAISNMAIVEADWLLERTRGAGPVRAALARALDRFPPDDPFGVEAALRTERDLVASLARRFRGPNAGRDFADMFLAMVQSEDDTLRRRALGSLEGEQFKAEVEKAVDAFDLVFEAWGAGDPAAELDALGQRFVEGDFGTVAILVVPAFGKTYESDAKARARLEAFRNRVKGDD